MANALVNDIRIYTRHSHDCSHVADASYLTCRCPKWLQYQLNGKQVKVTAKTRSKAGAEAAARRKSDELARLKNGEAPQRAVKLTPIADAIADWLKFREREQSIKTNVKAIKLSNMFLAWTRERNLTYLTQITKSDLIAFRSTLPYRSGDSSSLKIHWSTLCCFFTYCVGADLLEHSPVPTGPQFAIKCDPEEVVPFTQREYDLIIASVDKVVAKNWDALRRHKVRTYIHLLRWSGMAIVDAVTLPRTKLEGNLIRSNRTKTGKRFRVRIPQWLANDLQNLPCSDPEFFFWHRRRYDETQKLDRDHVKQLWSIDLMKVFRAAGLRKKGAKKSERAHAHKFRHMFISRQLAAGTPVDDVATMAGNSPDEIRKTYQHWVREAEERLDRVQEQSWIEQGLDRHGNRLSVQ